MEWQGGCGLSYVITCKNRLWKIIPYAGGKWAWVRVDTNHFQFLINDAFFGPRTLTIFDLKQQMYFGYAVGVTMTAWGNTAFTLEGSWVNEKALYFNTQFRF